MIELLEYIRIENYLINSLDNKKLSYNLTYSLKLKELKILKTFIKANLVNSFIRLSKFYACTLMLLI